MKIAVAMVMHGTQQGIVGQKTCDDCRSACSARLLTMCTSLSAEKEDEQDEPLRAKRRCAVDENDCDLQVATSRSRDTCPFKRDLPFRVYRWSSSRTRGNFLSGLVASGVKPPEVLLSLVAAQASGGFTFVWVGTGRLNTNLLDVHHFLRAASR